MPWEPLANVLKVLLGAGCCQGRLRGSRHLMGGCCHGCLAPEGTALSVPESWD